MLKIFNGFRAIDESLIPPSSHSLRFSLQLADQVMLPPQQFIRKTAPDLYDLRWPKRVWIPLETATNCNELATYD